MSLLADLLSKIQQPPSKREIPPNLKNIVQASAKRSSDKKKFIILGILFFAAVTAGLFIVYFIRTLTDAGENGIAAETAAMTARVERAQKTSHDTSGMLPQSGRMDSRSPRTAGGAVTPPVSEAQPETGPASGAEPAQEAPEVQETVMKEITEDAGESAGPPLITEKNIKADEIDAYLYSAREHEMKKDYSEALSDYKKALELDRNNVTVLNNIAYIYLRLDALEDSIRYALDAIDINSDYAPALTNLGIAYARAGNISGAGDYLDRALRIEPDNMDIIMNLAVLNERQDRLEEASGYFSRLARMGNLNGSLGMARIYEKQGRIDEALKLYRNINDRDTTDNSVRALIRRKIVQLHGRKMEPARHQ